MTTCEEWEPWVAEMELRAQELEEKEMVEKKRSPPDELATRYYPASVECGLCSEIMAWPTVKLDPNPQGNSKRIIVVVCKNPDCAAYKQKYRLLPIIPAARLRKL